MGELVVVAGGGGLALRARQPRNREFLFLLLGIGVSRPDPHGEASAGLRFGERGRVSLGPIYFRFAQSLRAS